MEFSRFNAEEGGRVRIYGQRYGELFKDACVAVLIGFTYSPLLTCLIVYYIFSLFTFELLHISFSYKIFLAYIDLYNITAPFNYYLNLLFSIIRLECANHYLFFSFLTVFIPYFYVPRNCNFWYSILLFVIFLNFRVSYFSLFLRFCSTMFFYCVRSPVFKLVLFIVFQIVFSYDNVLKSNQITYPDCSLCFSSFYWVGVPIIVNTTFGTYTPVRTEVPYCYNQTFCRSLQPFDLIYIRTFGHCASGPIIPENYLTMFPPNLAKSKYVQDYIHKFNHFHSKSPGFKKLPVFDPSDNVDDVTTKFTEAELLSIETSTISINPSDSTTPSLSFQKQVGFNVSHTSYPGWFFNVLEHKVYLEHGKFVTLMENSTHIRPLLVSVYENQPSLQGTGGMYLIGDICPGKSYFELIKPGKYIDPLRFCVAAYDIGRRLARG